MKYHAENAVSSFFYYMWNAWSKEECKIVFGGMCRHFWEKWNAQAEKSIYGAAERFYSELSENNQKLLVERAVSLYDGKAFRKEPDDSKVLVCEECGSRQVEIQAWIDANTEMFVCDTAHDRDGKWCEGCKENVNFCSLEEFKQKMQVWWVGTDFGTLENITGLKETDHFPGNGSQAFADAVKKWWDSLDYDGKRDLYNKYNSNNE